MIKKPFPLLLNLSLLIAVFQASPALAELISVHDSKSLVSATSRAQPGDIISLAAGHYGNGISISKLNGSKDKPIIISAADPKNPPLFEGGKVALHLSSCNYLTLSHLVISGCQTNGINADDGGLLDTPSLGLVFKNITIKNIGPTGNRDGLKLSGLKHFTVSNCHFSGWGGSAIDMVGCREGLIHQSRFYGKDGFSQSSGIQTKGGSENIRIESNYFNQAGDRAINLGGSTGLAFFRPEVRDFEAKSISVSGNRFLGSQAPIVFATSIECQVRHNTFVSPGKWVIRILQEQPTDRFKPCQKGDFSSNLIVYSRQIRTFVNVGEHTKAETFSFRNNAWFCIDGNQRPSLPVKEIEGVYQIDPKVIDQGTARLRATSQHPLLQKIGARAFTPPPVPLTQ
ncbi:MAG: right-handed parallel beta-helix repeat-containing protein [Verrucomicrobiota bacterium]